MSVDLGHIIRTHGPEFLKKHQEGLGYQQKRALNAIAKCRTGELGQSVYQCHKCQRKHVTNGSCSNRHCPLCQGHKTVAWVKAQQLKRLPVEYFFVTLTIPSELRQIVKRLGAKAYRLMFQASSEVIKELMSNPKTLGVTDVGFTSVLHTWGSQLQDHPHIHIILPGGGLTEDGKWKSFPRGFAFHARKASKLWQGKLLKGLEDLIGRENMPNNICDKEPIVNLTSAGDGRNIVKYLSRYVFKTGISNHRIISLENGHVTFKYKKVVKGERVDEVMTLSADEFISRFISHILPKGLVRVRHYGFNHSNSKIDLDVLKLKIMELDDQLLWHIKEAKLDKEDDIKIIRPICPQCKIEMDLIDVVRETVKTFNMTG